MTGTTVARQGASRAAACEARVARVRMDAHTRELPASQGRDMAGLHTQGTGIPGLRGATVAG